METSNSLYLDVPRVLGLPCQEPAVQTEKVHRHLQQGQRMCVTRVSVVTLIGLSVKIGSLCYVLI